MRKNITIFAIFLFTLNAFSNDLAHYPKADNDQLNLPNNSIAFHSGNAPGRIEGSNPGHSSIYKAGHISPRVAFCTEEDQKTALIFVEFSLDEDGNVDLIIQGLNMDGSISTEEHISGGYPTVTINTAVSDTGADLLIIHTTLINEGLTTTRVLTCNN